MEERRKTGAVLKCINSAVWAKTPIMVFCESCGRRCSLDRAKVPKHVTVQDLTKVLRCSSCGSREASIRIIYTGAGGLHHNSAP